MKEYNAPINKSILKNIKSESKVLDVGCSTGVMGKYLINNMNCIVYGIDWNEVELLEAQKNGYKNTDKLDLNSNKIEDFFLTYHKNNGQFDVIVLGDILEHLMEPAKLLRNIKQLIKSDGYIICSIPNIAFIYYRIQLMLGKWEYKKYGVMDETHLRFFTKKTIIELFEKADLSIIEITPNNQFYPLNYLKLLAKIFPGLFSYQFLVLAK